ncbi:MAG: HAD family hydrolase [Peptostreptococcaceae bacterium]|nr:HAD family hydrolase [Peptostreptococcaceae bacterium]
MKFVFDIDGTICFDGANIEPRIREILKDGKASGHEIIFASGRSYRDCIPVLKNPLAEYYIVGLNGGHIYNEGNLIEYKTIPYEVYYALAKFCVLHNIPYFVDDIMDYHGFHQDKMPFVEEIDAGGIAKSLKLEEIKNPIKMIIRLNEHPDKKDELMERLCKEQVDALFFERHHLLYVQPKNCSKGSVLKESLGDYICFGNDKNDISMFQNAKYAIQVGNLPELIPYAQERIPMNSNTIDKLCESILALYQKYK